MKIFGTPNINQTSEASKKRRVNSSGNFSAYLDEASATSATGSVAATSPTDALFALQQVSDEELGRSKGMKYATELLDQLEDLRLGIVNGEVSRGKLQQIAHHMRTQGTKVDDPKLRMLLTDIEIRAAVELAKLNMDV